MSVSWNSSVVVAQGSAGTTQLVAAPGAGLRIVVHGADISINGGGNFKLQSASTDITGPLYSHSSAHATVYLASGHDCVIRCNTNEALNLVSVTNPASGVVYYSIESV